MARPGCDFVHIWNRCHACATQPILGTRFECQTCPAGPYSDLCEKCYSLYRRGSIAHPMGKICERSPREHLHCFVGIKGKPTDQYLKWLTADARKAAPKPTIPQTFVVRPEFRCGLESFLGTYACIVESEDGKCPLALTALHLLDELAISQGISLRSRVDEDSVSKLSDLVTGATLYDVFVSQWVFGEVATANSMIRLPNARLGEEEPFADNDIAAFRCNPSTSISPAKLAKSPPQIGEPLWLVTATAERLTEAVVVDVTDRTLVFRFRSDKLDMGHTSGAPIVNGEGKVAGINVGRGMFSDCWFGHANHVANIRRHLGFS